MEVLENSKITSPYGERDGSFHRGVDVISKTGNRNVMANAKGKVIKIINEYPDAEVINPQTDPTTEKWGGNRVWLAHDNGYQSRYHHLKYNSIHVNVGDVLEEGFAFAEEGESGYATGVHLDFEVLKDGQYVDPTRYALGEETLPAYSANENKTEYVNLPAMNNGEPITSWRVYPLDQSPQYGSNFDHSIGKLNPSLFGGVSYPLQGFTEWNTPIIETRDFGKVHLALSNIATITNTPQFDVYQK